MKSASSSSPARARSTARSSRRRAAGGWRSGSTRSGRGRDGSTRRTCRAGWRRADARRPAAPRGGPSATSKAAPSRRPAATRSGRRPRTRRSCRRRSRPSTIRSRQPPAENSLWPGAHGEPAIERTSRIARRSLCQRHGSSNQRRSQVRDEAREASRPARAVQPWLASTVRHEVRRPPPRAPRANARRVLLGRRAADLELAARRARAPAGRSTSSAIAPAAVVVAADGDHRQRLAVAAPQAPQRLAERLADRVPDRGVDAGAGHEPEAAVAQDVERRRPRELPAALDREGVLAGQPRRDLVVRRSPRSRAAPASSSPAYASPTMPSARARA